MALVTVRKSESAKLNLKDYNWKSEGVEKIPEGVCGIFKGLQKMIESLNRNLITFAKRHTNAHFRPPFYLRIQFSHYFNEELSNSRVL